MAMDFVPDNASILNTPFRIQVEMSNRYLKKLGAARSGFGEYDSHAASKSSPSHSKPGLHEVTCVESSAEAE